MTFVAQEVQMGTDLVTDFQLEEPEKQAESEQANKAEKARVWMGSVLVPGTLFPCFYTGVAI